VGSNCVNPKCNAYKRKTPISTLHKVCTQQPHPPPHLLNRALSLPRHIIESPLMSNEWPFPYARNHVRGSVNGCSPPSRYYYPQMSPAAVGQGPSILPNTTTGRYGMNAVTKQCACTVCTGSTSNGLPARYTTYHQNWDTRPPGVSTCSPKVVVLSSDHYL
jgi:hypothetical protein